MADVTLNDPLKIGKFVGKDVALIKLTGVNTGATVTRSGDWSLMPDLEPGKGKRVTDPFEVKNRTGGFSVKLKTIIGYEYSAAILQRDAASYEMDLTYAGYESVLLCKGHYFRRLASPKQGWLAIFGMVVPHDADVADEDGKIPFMFAGIPNAQAIVLGAAGIAYPTGAGVAGWTSPGSDITIPVYNGSVGIYKIVDL